MLWMIPTRLGFCCLILFASSAHGTEFKPLDAHSRVRLDRIDAFVAADAFKVGSRIGGKTLSAVGLNFKDLFLGVVERDVPAADLNAWTLAFTTGDKSLLDAAGGESRIVPFLAYVHRLMVMGEAGPGHVDWRSNFAYMRAPVDGKIWAIHWTVNYDNEWTIGAAFVPHPDLDWKSGSRFFSFHARPER